MAPNLKEVIYGDLQQDVPTANKLNGKLGKERPSSFPNLWKFPEGRDKPFQSAVQWMQGKRVTDDVGNLWRVHDKLYDLTDFIARHPGGRDWISLSRGTDVTEAFEVSHIVNVKDVEAVLAKYYVCEASCRRNSPYTFHEDGFYKTLKRRAEPILKEVGTGSTLGLVLMQDGLAALVLALSIFGVWTNSTVVQVLAGLFLSLCVNSAHNFFHVRETWRKYYWDITMLSSYEWRISHVMSHHNFPNTVLDYELQMLEPIFMFLPLGSKSWFQRYGSIIYSHIIYYISFLSVLVSRMGKIWAGQQELRPENLIVFGELLVCLWLSPTAWAGLRSWAFIHSVASYWFVLIGMNAAHHHPVCFHDGDEARPEPDFGLCQLDAVRERSDDLQRNLFIILVTYGEHSLHHLFPSVCHSKLHHLLGTFERTLEEFSENFEAYPYIDFFVGAQKQLIRNTPNPFKAGSRKD